MATSTPEPKALDDKTDAELKREAKARLRRMDPAIAASLLDDVVGKQVSHSVSGFVTFMRERAVVGLAIGFVFGSQVQAVVNQFVTDFIDPLFKLLVPGNRTLHDSVWHVQLGSHSADFGWGALVYALLDFVFIIVIVYAVVKLFKLDRLDKK